VLLAILLDRVTQSFAKRDRPSWRERYGELRDTLRTGWSRAWMPLASGVLTALGLVYVVQLGALEASTEAPVAERSTTAEGAEPKTLRLGWTAWSDAEVVAHLTERLLRERIGQEVELTMADIGIQYQGVMNGELDVMIMAWLPTTHAPYWEKVGGKVTDLGPLYTRARLGWIVPAYVPESELRSIADLKKADVRKRLDGRIQGIDPGSGLMQASEKAMQHYGLDGYELVSSSGAAMAAAVERAHRERKWVVATAWSPHWLFARYDLRYLEDPDRVLGGRESVHALGRRGLYQDFPVEVTELLTRMFLPIDELEAVMLDASERSVDEAIDAYIEAHPRRIHYWVTGEMSGADSG
jgi:glycine betaine/proline transport system substrate-binding protein